MNNDQDEELKLSKTHFDAIKLLEGALQKMDGIISTEPISNSKCFTNSNGQTVLKNSIQQENSDDSSDHLESFKLQVSMLNNQVDILLRKLNHLEKYLLQQNDLRKKAESKLQEEMILKSKLETEKLEVIAMLTNLKLVNVRLTKENRDLKEMIINNQNAQNSMTSSGTPEVVNSHFQRSKNQGSRFYCSLPRHNTSKNRNENQNINNELLNDITESCANLMNRKSQFDKCSSAPNLVDSKHDCQNEQILENSSSLFSSTKIYTFQNSNLLFSELNRQQLQDWFAEQGIDYVLEGSKLWPTSGKELISSSIGEIDEKFKFKHWLHRKKLILAIQFEKDPNKLNIGDKYVAKTRYLNTSWVLQWLDDIGLPQYKESFSQAAINGTLLHRLTKDDFLMMPFENSDLHFSSLRYGIKVLRKNNFDPECLIRRSNTNKNDDDYNLSLWTTHRVMEWLCSVNLAEYASNLRGSGVHGGLIVYDDRFTSELLADILFIQQSKTLLRRHLSIQFSQLIGRDLNQKKRDNQCKPKYRPLTISSKTKENSDDSSDHLESFKLQVSMLNNQVDILLRKLNHLEKYLLQQNDLRKKAESKLQEEMILKSKLETEKLEVIAMLTNLKLVNVRLTKENRDLKEMIINNQNAQNSMTSSGTPEVVNSHFQRSKNQGSRFYCSLPRHNTSKNRNENQNINNELLNDITESCANLMNRKSQFDKCSSAPNLVDSKHDCQNEQILENSSSLFSSTKIYTFQNSNLLFSELNRQQLQDWFAEQGIDYVLEGSKLWPTSGKELISSSIGEIDEKFKFKHWLHRKKLILAIQFEKDPNKLNIGDKYVAKTRYLNTSWVLQWLDDIGLPQYKESFSQAAINGTLLHRLTKDDFLMMPFENSDLHFSSLRYGIKVLRKNNFDPECLIRRSNTNKNDDDYNLSLWTTHRVMEWLCSVNLAEYASNLRGSGVHGGLIVYDDRFTSELLADILFIQQSKTLLRRHLSIQFSQLIGRDLNQKKRDNQCKPKYRPLTISSKTKIKKKSQFSLKRKIHNNELSIGDLICPMDD